MITLSWWNIECWIVSSPFHQIMITEPRWPLLQGESGGDSGRSVAVPVIVVPSR